MKKVSFILGLCLFGCDRFETPDVKMCEAAVTQLIVLDGEGDSKSANILDKAKGQLNLAKEKLTGDYKARLEQCQNEWNVHKTTCVVEAKAPAQAAACGKWL